MKRTIVDYLLCFLAGSIVAAGGVLAVGGGSWHGRSFGPAPDVGDLLTMLSPAVSALTPGVLAVVGIVILAVALITFYWRDGVALAKRRRRPSPVSNRLPVAHSVERPRDPAEVDAVRDELERQLGRLIVLIANHLEGSRDHVASLKEANASLASVTSASELREVVRSLISNSETNERQTRDLEVRLKRAQDQAAVLRKRLSRAEKLAALDPLTSLANRRRFEQFISAEVDQSHENGTPLCLILTDIDHFKRVNDTYGHSAGDRVLKAFADLLSRNARESDLVARYGGEEFAVVLPQTPMGDAFGIAERIRRLLERSDGPDERRLKEFGRLTASFGIAEILDGEPPSALIQRADQKLYEAKSNGRNKTMVCSSSFGGLDSEHASTDPEPASAGSNQQVAQ
jgi:diguanylate cyclase (GGDEF)-like protein